MKRSAIANRILKIGMIGLVSAVLSCAILNPSLARSRSKRITLENQVDPDPLIVRGISGGEVEATDLVDTEGTTTGFCNGFVNNRPNHVLVLKSFFEFLKIEVDSSTDTTIVVEGPGGVWCNDDSDDANPAIEGQWQPGRYKIWIGSYQEDINYDYQIRITGED